MDWKSPQGWKEGMHGKTSSELGHKLQYLAPSAAVHQLTRAAHPPKAHRMMTHKLRDANVKQSSRPGRLKSGVSGLEFALSVRILAESGLRSQS